MTRFKASLAAPTLLLGLCGPGLAQVPGCRGESLTDPPRQVLRCGTRLTVTAEGEARFRLREGRGGPSGAELDGSGLLVETPGRPFQIRTPHAVASVRGTVWAVDVEAGRTSVFVESGRVAVARRGGGRPVRLGAGQGVDVATGTGPLEVRTWPQERVRRLLARFGR